MGNQRLSSRRSYRGFERSEMVTLDNQRAEWRHLSFYRSAMDELPAPILQNSTALKMEAIIIYRRRTASLGGVQKSQDLPHAQYEKAVALRFPHDPIH